jgi:hypothetical protein
MKHSDRNLTTRNVTHTIRCGSHSNVLLLRGILTSPCLLVGNWLWDSDLAEWLSACDHVLKEENGVYSQEMDNFRVTLGETSDTSSSDNKCWGRDESGSESDMSGEEESISKGNYIGTQQNI